VRGLGIDYLSLMLIWLTIWVYFLAIFVRGVRTDNKLLIGSIGFLSFLLFLCFISLSLVKFFIFFEAVLVPILLIIFVSGGQFERVQAGVYLMFYTLTGSLPLLIFLLAHSQINSISYLFLAISEKVIEVRFPLLYILAFLVKLPLYGVHY